MFDILVECVCVSVCSFRAWPLVVYPGRVYVCVCVCVCERERAVSELVRWWYILVEVFVEDRGRDGGC